MAAAAGASGCGATGSAPAATEGCTRGADFDYVDGASEHTTPEAAVLAMIADREAVLRREEVTLADTPQRAAVHATDRQAIDALRALRSVAAASPDGGELRVEGEDGRLVAAASVRPVPQGGFRVDSLSYAVSQEYCEAARRLTR